MAETVAVHHPAHPGSDIVVSRKAFDLDLRHEGYVEGRSDGTNPVTAPTPPAPDGGDRATISTQELEALRASLTGVEERETALALREVELDQRERDLEAREEELAASYAQPAPQGDASTAAPAAEEGTTPAPTATPDSEAQRKAAKAAAERERRARKAAEKAAADATGQEAGTTTPPEDA